MSEQSVFWFGVVYFSLVVLLILAILVLRITLDPRVRKALPSDKTYNSPLDWYGGLFRAIGFGYAALFDRAKRYAMLDYYDGFDVKAFANRFEKAIAWIMVVSLSVFLLMNLFYLITKPFGLLEWPGTSG
jgi:hypothetical protein